VKSSANDRYASNYAVRGVWKGELENAGVESTPLIQSGGRYSVVYPEFHFHDPSGTARFIHREVVATNAPKALPVNDGVIDISANQQIRGATYVGGWHRGSESYYVGLRAFILNLEGVKSNIVEYTIHCNGG
jgi:hypothetical protein